MRRAFAALAGALAWAAGAGSSLAEPPNLNVLESAAGESEGELTGFFATRGPDAAPGFQYNVEINRALSDRLGLQVQMTGADTARGLRAHEVSLQGFYELARRSEDARLGVSAEAAFDPSGGAASVGALVYGLVPVAGWRTAFNLGADVGASSEDAAFVYAWSASRDLFGRLVFSLEGGGAEPLRGDEAGEHYAGPSLAVQLREEGPELKIGYLIGLTAASPDLVQAGVSLAF